MSRGTNNFTVTPDDWEVPQEYFDLAYLAPLNHRPFPRLSRAFSYRTNPDQPGRLVEDRETPWPSNLAGYSMAASPFILVENVYARPRVLIHEPPLRFMPRTNWQMSLEQGSRPITNEQKALSKLRKEIYNPLPKRFSSRLGLYYREEARKGSGGGERKSLYEDEDGKRCAVCLEDFEPKQEVMVTPCNHMFHEDCIVPWVLDNVQCPVCRHAFGE